MTLDQQLYIKAYKILFNENERLFAIRLISSADEILGSIGSLMEGSRLRSALETVYAPASVGHMFSGKAYSCAIYVHFLSTSALLLIMFEEFWNKLNTDEKNYMKKMYESDNPSVFEDDEISTKLGLWFIKRQKELSKNSRTSALWLSYARYIFIVQEFIPAKRTSNWPLHILATKSMLNLFAATGHNNYAKTTRLYLQSAAALEKDHPEVYQQFLLGNHTVRYTKNNW